MPRELWGRLPSEKQALITPSLPRAPSCAPSTQGCGRWGVVNIWEGGCTRVDIDTLGGFLPPNSGNGVPKAIAGEICSYVKKGKLTSTPGGMGWPPCSAALRAGWTRAQEYPGVMEPGRRGQGHPSEPTVDLGIVALFLPHA